MKSFLSFDLNSVESSSNHFANPYLTTLGVACVGEGAVDEFQNNTELGPKEVLKKSVRRKIVIGVVMMVMLPLLPLVVFLIQYSVSDFVILMVFVSFGIVGFSGLILMTYFGIASSMLLHGYELLEKLSPPNPMILNRTVVLNRKPVHIVVQWGSNTIYFVAFHQAERAFDLKMRIPRFFWRWEYTHQIGEVNVARRDGTFTIPVEDGMYLSGTGIIYSLMVERGVKIRLRLDFEAEQLNQIIDHLANDIQSDSSGF